MIKKLFLFLFSIFSLISCSNKDLCDCKDYQNRQFLNYYETYGLTSLDNFFSLSNDMYYIYLYSITCPRCENIKGCVLDYLDTSTSPPLYLLQKDKIENLKDYFKALPPDYNKENRETLIKECINKSSLSEIYYFGTPTLIEINENKLTNMLVGETSLINFFSNF